MVGNDKETNHKNIVECLTLKNINLKIRKGEFLCVIGDVGSGKSSLLSSINGDMIYVSDDTIGQFKDSA